MKKKYFLTALAIGSFAAAMTSCDPIEDRDTLSNSFDPNNIEVVATADVDGGNKITLEMKTPGVIGYWDYKLGQAFTDKVTFVCPFTGNLEFTFYSTTPVVNGDNKFSSDNLPSKSVSINVTQLNNRLEPEFYTLIGDDLAGKVWTFDHSYLINGGEEGFWYMANNGGKEKWNDCWWNAGGTCCPPPDQYGALKFDLDGGMKVYHYAEVEDANPDATANFSFSDKNTKIAIPFEAMIGTNDGRSSANDVYDIVELSDNRLILYCQETKAGDSGWTWVMKPLN